MDQQPAVQVLPIPPLEPAGPVPPLRVEFTCTLEDHTEALQIHRRALPGSRMGWFERLLFLWVLLGALALLIGSAIVEAIILAGSGAAPGAKLGMTTWLGAVLTPWVLWIISFGLIWFGLGSSLARAEATVLRNLLLLGLGLGLAMNIVGTLTTGAPPATTQPAAPATPAEEASFLTAWGPWLIVFFVFWFFIYRYLRGAPRRSWDAQPQLRLPQCLEQTDRGLRFVDEQSTVDYAWSAFPRYAEGRNLFILLVSQVGFHMVPKRAFADAAQLDAFRALLARHVPGPGAAPTGFPISPPSAGRL